MVYLSSTSLACIMGLLGCSQKQTLDRGMKGRQQPPFPQTSTSKRQGKIRKFLKFIPDFYVLMFCLHVYLCKGVGSPGTDSYELPCGSWEFHLGPLEDHPSYQLLFCLFLNQVIMTHTYNLSTLEALDYIVIQGQFGLHIETQVSK